MMYSSNVVVVSWAVVPIAAAAIFKRNMPALMFIAGGAALVTAGALPFAQALEAVSARGREMTNLSVDDNGLMAAVFAPLAEIEAALAEVDGYVVIANINSDTQAVIGGASPAVEAVAASFRQRLERAR